MKLPIILGLLTASITASFAQPFRDTTVLQLADTKVLTAETSQAQHLNLNPFFSKGQRIRFWSATQRNQFRTFRDHCTKPFRADSQSCYHCRTHLYYGRP